MSVHQISLNDHEDSFVREQVSQGRYASASDVLKAGLASLKSSVDADAEWRAWLCAEAKVGFDELDAGLGIDLSDPAIRKAWMQEILDEVLNSPPRLQPSP